MSRQFSRENRRGHQVTNLMVRSAQEVDWYCNINTGHNILILKKEVVHKNALVQEVTNLQLALYSSITLSTLTPRIECQVKVSLFRCFFTPIHTIKKEMVFP